MEYPFILGTAGHIDHGKTALVRAMTGVDCDRLIDEKKRGITIELGFAPLTLDSGRTVSIIDVPGHEKFIRQMVAGASGIDAVMLIVAADEGVMPQTREHLDILALLGISTGIVVLTKRDLVDEGLLELAIGDVRGLVAGTFLENAPIVAVSSTTGEGIPELRAALEVIVDTTATRRRQGAFFLPIDRAFTIKGFGSVITGTSYQGSINEGDDVEIMPRKIKSKARSIQIHGAAEKTALAGQRTAVNLASVSLSELERGDVVCASGRFEPTECLDANISVLPSAPSPLIHWQRVHLHIGTAEVIARVLMLKGGSDPDRLHPGESGMVQLLPEEPIVAINGGRFVVRLFSPLITIGGGSIMLSNALRVANREDKEFRASVLEELKDDLTSEKTLETMIVISGGVWEDELLMRSQMEDGEFRRSLGILAAKKNSKVIVARSVKGDKRLFVSERRYRAIESMIVETIEAFHKAKPQFAGIDAEMIPLADMEIAARFPIDDRVRMAILERIASSERICKIAVADSYKYSMPGFVPSGGEKFMKFVDSLRAHVIAAGYELADAKELPDKLNASKKEVELAISYLVDNESLKMTSDGFVFPQETRERALAALRSIDGEITLAAFRDALGTSRKFALAIIEFFDSNEITRRVGDKRVLLKK